MKCSIVENSIGLEKPFSYFLGTLDTLEYSKIVITDGDVSGVGEIVNSLDVNGQTQESVQSIEQVITAILSAGPDTISSIEDIRYILDQIKLYLSFNAGVLCGVEQALFDILAQKNNTTLLELLGGKQGDAPKKIQITIPFLDSLSAYQTFFEDVIRERKPDYVKFKIGKDLDIELAAIKALTETEDISISVDANQAFNDVDAAIDYANKLDELGVAWAEQLLVKDDLAGLKKLRESTKLRLMADEALHTLLEAEYLVQNNLVDYFNIKLAKTGGILEARRIIKLAKENNIKYMLGSMLHGDIGIRYNLSFAMSEDFVTQDFFSYFSVSETKDSGLISEDLYISAELLL